VFFQIAKSQLHGIDAQKNWREGQMSCMLHCGSIEIEQPVGLNSTDILGV
jgi:hypothetical protein